MFCLRVVYEERNTKLTLEKGDGKIKAGVEVFKKILEHFLNKNKCVRMFFPILDALIQLNYRHMCLLHFLKYF